MVEAGIEVSAAEASACPLCSADSSHESHRTPAAADRRDDLLPWAIGLTTAVVVASVGIGSDRWFGIGAVAGVLAGAGLAWQSVRSAVRARQTAHDQAIGALSEDADGRVAMVIRQFEWAVNDVVKLKREHERAQVTADLLVVQGRARESHVRKLEREILQAHERAAAMAPTTRWSQQPEFEPGSVGAAGAVPIRWGLHHDGYHSRLELESDARAYRPTRLRIVDPTGTVQIESMTAMHPGDGSLRFTLADPPAGLIADLVAGRQPGYTLEAQCGYQWRPVRLEDTGRRTRLVMDKQGQQYRMSEAPAAHQPAVAPHNPFDYTFDSTVVTLTL